MASFFIAVVIPSAQLVPLQAPKHRSIIGSHPIEQTAFRRDIKDSGYKSVFTNVWLERQRFGSSQWRFAGKKSHKHTPEIFNFLYLSSKM